MKQQDEFIYIANRSIKSIGNTGEIGEYSIVFGNEKAKDFHGNWFTEKTFRGHNRDGAQDVGFLNHRVPMFSPGQFEPEVEKALKKISDMRFKNPVITTVDEVGEFSKLVLDLNDKYEKMVYELAKKGVFKWSSGTGPQGYKSLPTGELEMFVVFEKSLTPIPAEARMLEHRVMPLKFYADFLEKSVNPSSNLKHFFMGFSPITAFENSMKGGKGSGFHGHKGRPGYVGGSSSGLEQTSSKPYIEQARKERRKLKQFTEEEWLDKEFMVNEFESYLGNHPNLTEEQGIDVMDAVSEKLNYPEDKEFPREWDEWIGEAFENMFQ